MIKGICVLVLFTSGLFVNEQVDRDPDIIYWHEQKLSWDDFQGLVLKDSEYAAVSNCSIHSFCSGKGDTLYCEIYTEFRKSKSWKKSEHATSHILSHEQRHFDLTEYLTRCYRKAIIEYRFESAQTALSEVDSLMVVYDNKFDQWQDLYDEETDRSKNKEAQVRWDNKIDSLLLSMEDYSMTRVNVYIGYLYD